jgi:hypothetical protein
MLVQRPASDIVHDFESSHEPRKSRPNSGRNAFLAPGLRVRRALRENAMLQAVRQESIERHSATCGRLPVVVDGAALLGAQRWAALRRAIVECLSHEQYVVSVTTRPRRTVKQTARASVAYVSAVTCSAFDAPNRQATEEAPLVMEQFRQREERR